MELDVNGTRLWFDVDGPSLVPEASTMRARPTVVVLHGGPGTYDHSYFKPHFAALSNVAQVIYVDLRSHGRSAREDPRSWTFELCADDVRAFCDALGIVRPVVLGHSMGGIVAMLYGAHHPGHAGGLVLQSTMARFDLDRLVEGFRRVAGDDVAELAHRDYGDAPVDEAAWRRVFAAFGPRVPEPVTLARRVQNLDLAPHGMERLRALDVVGQLGAVSSPVLVCVGDLDPVTPIAAAEEIVDALPTGIARLELLEGAGHFPWLDLPDRYWAVLRAFAMTGLGSAGEA